MRIFIVVVALVAAQLGACKASVNVKANAGVQEPQEESATVPSMSVPEPKPQPVRTDYFGIARGLRLKEGTRRPNCTCVAAVVGSASNDAFVWRGTAPAVGEDALVLAISAEGVPCDRAGPGPSVRAVEQVGDDVVVVLEEAHPAHPIVSGAIIPNPGAGGGVYLRAHGKSTYGNPIGAAVAAGHAKWCQVGTGQSLSVPQANPEPNVQSSP